MLHEGAGLEWSRWARQVAGPGPSGSGHLELVGDALRFRRRRLSGGAVVWEVALEDIDEADLLETDWRDAHRGGFSRRLRITDRWGDEVTLVVTRPMEVIGDLRRAGVTIRV